MPPRSLDPEAWSWNHGLAVFGQKTLGHLCLIVLPVPAKGQRLEPGQDPPKSDRRRPTAEADLVAVLISAELDQHPSQAGFDGVREGWRVFFEDEPRGNAEPRKPQGDAEEGTPHPPWGRAKEELG